MRLSSLRPAAVAALCLPALLAPQASAAPTGTAAAVRYDSLRDVGLTVRSASLKSRTLRVKVTASRPMALRFAIVRGSKQLGSAKRSVPRGTTSLTLLLNKTSTGSPLRLRVTARIGGTKGRARVGVGVVTLPMTEKPVPSPASAGPAAGTPAAPAPAPAPAPNRAPTALALSPGSVAEGSPVGTTVGTFSGTDPDAGDTLAFSLVPGAAENAAFTLDGGVLRTATALDRETKSTYALRARVTDGRGGAFEQDLTVTVTDVGEAPVLGATASPLAYRENDPATPVDPGLTVTDQDSPELAGATVTLSGGQAGDALGFTDQAGIRGSVSGDVLTLTGTASRAAYTAALRSVTFAAATDAPTASRSVRFSASDATSSSAPVSRAITITAVDDAPVLDASDADLAYVEGAGPLAADPGIVVTDPDSAELSGGTVSLSAGYDAGQDALAFATQNGISGSFSAATGTLTLSGTASVAGYQAALRSVTYENRSDAPAPPTRTLRFVATDAGGVASAPVTRGVTLGAANDAATVTTTPAALTVAEGAAATAADPGLTLADPDDTTLTGARVRVSGGLQDGDALGYADQGGITGAPGAAGELLLSGTASLAAYQSALRSVTFRTTNDAPTTAKTLSFQADDGDGLGPASTRTVTVTPVNDVPVLQATPGDVTYTEGDGAVRVDAAISLTDPDSDTRTAFVSIGAFVAATDELGATAEPGTTVTYDDANGVLQVDGTGVGPGVIQTVLRSVRYENSGQNPTGTKRFSFQVVDDVPAAPRSNVATRDFSLLGSDDPPVANADAATVTEDAAATAIDVRVNDSDVDGGALEVTAISDPANGATTFTASGVTYAPDADFCGTDSFTYTLNGGSTATVTVTVTCVNDAPVVTVDGRAVRFVENGPPIAVDGSTTLRDVDSATVSNITFTISSNYDAAQDRLTATVDGQPVAYPGATGTVAGVRTLAEAQAILRSISYQNLSDAPTNISRTLTMVVTDAQGAASTPADALVFIERTDDESVLTTSPGSTAYTENAPGVAIDPGLTISDVDDATISSATVEITGGREAGDLLAFTTQNGISGDLAGGRLSLSGTASIADYQAALRSVRFSQVGDAPEASRTVSFNAGASAIRTKQLAITPVDDRPSVGVTSEALEYPERSGPVAADAGLAVRDPDSTQITGASVEITAGFDAAQDILAFTDQLGISGAYANGRLVLTGTTSLANYQAALRTVTFENTSAAPAPPQRTLTFIVRDATLPSSGASRDVNLGSTNDAATVTTTPAPLTYTENAAAVAVDGGLTVADPDDTNLEGARVALTGGRQDTDVLAFAAQNGITVTSPSAGVLVLAGTATVAQYQAALSSVTYRSPDEAPSTPKTVSFQADDGDGLGPASTRTIQVTAVNDAPVLTAGGTLAYAEGAGPVALASALTVTDVDSTQLTGAVVQLTTGFSAAQDALALPAGTALAASYAPATGRLTISGTATLAAYEAALRTVTYENTSENPTTARTAALTVTDAEGAMSGTATRQIAITPSNDAPVVTTSAGPTSYVEDAAPTVVDGGLTVADPDDAALTRATAQLTTGLDTGDVLAATTTGALSSSFAGGTLTITGSGTVAEYQAALRSVRFSSTSQNPSATKIVTFLVRDGSVDSAAATKALTVTRVNDAPVLTATGAALAYTEGDGPVAVDPGLTVADADSTQAGSATVQFSSGFVAAQDELLFTSQNGITGSYDDAAGTLALTGTATQAQYQAALRSVRYENGSEGPTPSRIVTFSVTDAEGAEGAASRGIAITGVNDPPVAVDDTGATNENQTLTVAAPGVLANDTDPDPGDTRTVVAFNGTGGLTGTTAEGAAVTLNANGAYTYAPGTAFDALAAGQTTTDTFTYTMRDAAGTQRTATVTITVTGVNDAPAATADSFDAIGNTGLYVSTARPAGRPGKVTAGDVLANDSDPDGPRSALVVEPRTNAATTRGGLVTIAADGTFSYEPPVGVTGVTDTFAYRVCDAAPCTSATDANATGTLNLVLSGQVWYLKNDAAAGGDGTSDGPFDTLAEAEAAASIGDTTFVFKGTGTTAGLSTGYLMEADERLVGEQTGLAVDPDAAGPLGTAALYAATADAFPLLTTTQTEDVVTMAARTTVEGLQIDPGAGGGGIGAGTGSQSGAPAASALTLRNLRVVDTAPTTTQPALELSTVTGTSTISDLLVTTATGPGVRLLSAGVVNVLAQGTTSVAATGGPALTTSATATGGMTFDTISSTGSSSEGIRLTGLTGPFTGSAGTIGGAAGTSFAVDGGDGAVQYDGALADGTGSTAILVANRTGGSVTLTGAIADGADAGGSLVLSANTSGTTTLSNPSKVFDTASADAVKLTGGGVNESLQMTGGGLDVDATSGRGVYVTSGRVRIQGAGNTVKTTTGTAFTVDGAIIDGGGVMLDSVSSNGAPNGVVLNGTGTGSFQLTGPGTSGCVSATTCGAGAIQNSTGNGISLTNVSGQLLFARLFIGGSGGDGFAATTTNGILLTDSVLSGNGDAAGDHGVDWSDMTGTGRIDYTSITGSAEDNARVAGSRPLNLTVDFSTFSGNSSSIGAHGLELRPTGTLTATVTNNTFSANRDNAFLLTNDGGAPAVSLRFTGNTVTGGNASALSGQPGVVVAPTGGADVVTEISANTISGTLGRALVVNPLPGSDTGASLNATIVANTIGTATASSGSAQGEGMALRAAGSGASRFSVRGNTVRNTAQNGIWLRAQEGAGTADFTLTGNTIQAPGAGFEGIYVSSGATSADSSIVCADIGGAGALGNTFAGTGTGGASDISFRRRFATDLRLPGYTTGADLTTYIRSRNPGSPTAASISNALTGQPGACLQPATP